MVGMGILAVTARTVAMDDAGLAADSDSYAFSLLHVRLGGHRQRDADVIECLAECASATGEPLHAQFVDG